MGFFLTYCEYDLGMFSFSTFCDCLILLHINLQMERKRGWLEKELEMLYAVMQQQNPGQTLKITNEIENSELKREESSLQPMPDALSAQITDVEESSKFSVIATPAKRSSSSPLTASVPLKSGPVC